MRDLQQAFATAQRAYQSGDYEVAVQQFRVLARDFPEQPAIHHLLGLSLKKGGDLQAAREVLSRGIGQHPDVAPMHAELASILDDLDDWEAAIAAYDRAIALDPNLIDARIDRAVVRHKRVNARAGFRELQALAEEQPKALRIWFNLAIMARYLGEFELGDQAVDRVLEVDPSNQKALRLRAQLAMDRGRPAIALFREARAIDPTNHEAIAGEASALSTEGKIEQAAELLEGALERTPEWVKGHSMLAQIRWQAGEGSDFARSYRAALEQLPTNHALWADYAIGTARAIGHEEALPIFEEARRTAGQDSYLDMLHACSLSEIGAHDQASRFFDELEPIDHPAYRLPLIRHCLMTREFERARDYGLALVEQGHGPDAWPYVSLAWRMLNDPKWGWLEGEHDLAQAIDMDELQPELDGLAERLRALHRWQKHPFEQSLRGGTQTDLVLFNREEPEIRSLVGHVRRAVASYIAALPAMDPDHPVLSKPRDDFNFSGSWSVRLTDSGYHVAHIHNQGWLSSALYVVLPKGLGDGTQSQDGWLAIGEPPSEFGLDLDPVKLIKPKPGRLALFPSISWHGTRPFSAGERMTVAFDIVSA